MLDVAAIASAGRDPDRQAPRAAKAMTEAVAPRARTAASAVAPGHAQRCRPEVTQRADLADAERADGSQFADPRSAGMRRICGSGKHTEDDHGRCQCQYVHVAVVPGNNGDALGNEAPRAVGVSSASLRILGACR